MFPSDIEGWERFQILDGIDTYANEKGIQVNISSLKDDEGIYVSICPVRSLRRELNDEEHNSFLLEETPAILKLFFENKFIFSRRPEDPRQPSIHHYVGKLK